MSPDPSSSLDASQNYDIKHDNYESESYIERNSVEDILSGIVFLSRNPDSKDTLIKNALVKLKIYYKIESTIIEEFNYIKYLYKNN